MGDVRLTAGNRGRALIAGVAVCLFLLQSFAVIFLLSGQAGLSHSDGATALARAGKLCDGGSHDDGQAPAPHHHQHCALCAAGNRDLSLDSDIFLVASVIVLALPQSEASPAQVRHDELKPPLSGWASTWPQRAPPSFS